MVVAWAAVASSEVVGVEDVVEGETSGSVTGFVRTAIVPSTTLPHGPSVDGLGALLNDRRALRVYSRKATSQAKGKRDSPTRPLTPPQPAFMLKRVVVVLAAVLAM